MAFRDNRLLEEERRKINGGIINKLAPAMPFIGEFMKTVNQPKQFSSQKNELTKTRGELYNLVGNCESQIQNEWGRNNELRMKKGEIERKKRNDELERKKRIAELEKKRVNRTIVKKKVGGDFMTNPADLVGEVGKESLKFFNEIAEGKHKAEMDVINKDTGNMADVFMNCQNKLEGMKKMNKDLEDEISGKGIKGGSEITQIPMEEFTREKQFMKPNNIPLPIKKILNTYGDYIVKRYDIVRIPLQEVLKNAINLITLGKLKKNAFNAGVDEMFHLFMVFTIYKHDKKDTKYILLEKNQRIMAEVSSNPIKPKENQEILNVQVLGDRPLITYFILAENYGEKRNPNWFWRYNAITANCQVFVVSFTDANTLTNNGMLQPPKGWMEWVLQPADKLIRSKFLRRFMLGITDLGAVVDKLMKGGKTEQSKQIIGGLTDEQLKSFLILFDGDDNDVIDTTGGGDDKSDIIDWIGKVIRELLSRKVKNEYMGFRHPKFGQYREDGEMYKFR